MRRIVSLASELPAHRLTPAATCATLAPHLAERARARLGQVLAARPFSSRFAVEPLELLCRLHGVAERSRLYAEHAPRLGAAAARRALELARCRAADVSHLIAVSSTDHVVPSLATLLVRELGLGASTRAVPLTDLGCAGGSAALALAADLARAGGDVLVVCVELPWLHLQVAEPSVIDVLGMAQFGDGAAAAVVSARADAPGIALERGTTCRPPDGGACDAVSTETGRRMRTVGLSSREVRSAIVPAADALLAEGGLARCDLAFWAVQPRSAELLALLAQALDLGPDELAPAERVWQRSGNSLSASALFVLEEIARAGMLASAPPGAASGASGVPGLLLTPGAGGTCELQLLRWLGAPAL